MVKGYRLSVTGYWVAGWCVLTFLLGYCTGANRRGERRSASAADTVVVVRRDTVRLASHGVTITDTVVRVEQVVRYVRRVDTVTLLDSVQVELPLEHHHAQWRDTADVWYSGYEAHLDSARFFLPTVERIITHEAEVRQKPRFGLYGGVSGGWSSATGVGAAVGGAMAYHMKYGTVGVFGGFDVVRRTGGGGLTIAARLDFY